MDSDQFYCLLNCKQLKAKLKELGLQVTGTKVELINRLKDHYKSKETHEEILDKMPITGEIVTNEKVAEELCQFKDQAKVQQARLEALELELKVLKTEKQISELKGEKESNNLKDVVTELRATRGPVIEPPIFSGDTLKFITWKLQFEAMIKNRKIIDSEKLIYLGKYLSGKALSVVEHLFLVQSPDTFDTAMKLLEQRYGDPYLVSQAFISKLANWPTIKNDDHVGLSDLSDFVKQCVAAKKRIDGLQALDLGSEQEKLLSHLPKWLTNKWFDKVAKYKLVNDKYPPFEVLAEFLQYRALVANDPIIVNLKNKQSKSNQKANKSSLAMTSQSVQVQQQPYHNNSLSRDSTNSQAFRTTNRNINKQCKFCNDSTHMLNECPEFLKKPWNERHQFIHANRLCFGCLSQGHRSLGCLKRFTCTICNKHHPTCLHNDKPKQARVTNTVVSDSDNNEQAESSAPESLNVSTGNSHSIYECVKQSLHINCNKEMLTTIVPVWVSHKSNPEHEVLVYALLDSMSDVSFILDETCDDLNVDYVNTNLKLGTMTAPSTRITCKKVSDLQVRAFNDIKSVALPPVYSRKFIPVDVSHIPTPDKVCKWSHLSNIVSEIPPMQHCNVGLLIGYNCAQAFLPRKTIVGGDNQPFAIKTDLGWGVIGGVDIKTECDNIGITNRIVTLPTNNICNSNHNTNVKSYVAFNCSNDLKESFTHEIINALELDFVDSCHNDRKISQEDKRFLSIIESGITQDTVTGHYFMPLPFKNNPSLPNNRSAVKHRLDLLYRKLSSDAQYKDQYFKFMNDMINSGQAEKVNENSQETTNAWYIPHFGVKHPKKKKLRIVFDCSAKFQSMSLNNCLLPGPDMMNNLVGILLRFRLNNVAITCDIEKMYYQFYVNNNQRDFLRFLWYSDESMQSIVDYRMTVHLFGATSSPACATYGLRTIAHDHCDPNNESSVMARDFITHNFYVDDGIVSVPDVKTAIKLCENARSICNKGGVRLHKFLSNSTKVLSSLPESEIADSVKHIDFYVEGLPMERTLGINWYVQNDEFQFCVNVKNSGTTRRAILSIIASIYDPMGFLAPFILTGKRLLQQLCFASLSWDDPLPDQYKHKWEGWFKELKDNIGNISIPRQYWPSINPFLDLKIVELHHFSDASEKGYGQCSYLRMISHDSDVKCAFVIGKSRVAPKKIVTIPRLELQAAVVSVKIAQFLKHEFGSHIVKEFFWTDSKVVLGYINNEARRFHTFVANRVQLIRNFTRPDQWNYVTSANNPADVASRECKLSDLSEKWLKGPDFLYKLNLEVSKIELNNVLQNDDEVKHVNTIALNNKSQAFNVVQNNPLYNKIQHFSDWNRLLKFIRVFMLKANSIAHPNTAVDLVDIKCKCERVLIRLTQQEFFSEEINILSNSNITKLSKQSPLFKLQPFLDNNNILRVGGRLCKSQSLLYNEKHPVILPKKSHVTNLIIRLCHELSAHQGRGITVNTIRSHGFWIIGMSRIVSSYIHYCVTCRKERGKTQVQKMADLPIDRIENHPPFTVVGCDCFGPFYVHEYRKSIKRFAVLFTCFYSRAIHVELLEDLSHSSFINAFRCLIAIRGNVRTLYCDNATNFTGTKHEFEKALKESAESLANLNCDFVFNPPYASHMGGVWERQIRSVRSILNNLLNSCNVKLNTFELRTLMYETMAIVNSRPLAVNNLYDPLGPTPLTPNHLLNMKSQVLSQPPGNFSDVDLYTKKRWRKIQFLANEFWNKWRKQYLINIQTCNKWYTPKCNVKKDDVVLLSDDNTPRNTWKLGRVLQAIPSEDGLVRRVKVTLGHRGGQPQVLERPVHKLIVLLSPTAV